MKSRTCQDLLLFAALMFLLGNRNPAWADQTSITDASLAQLENRFFEHPYNKDTEEDRLSRLEGFIFGSAQQGTVDERLKHILATIPKESDNPPVQSSNSRPSESKKATSESSAGSDVGSLPNGSTYPRVTSLEQELLGHTFVDDSLTKQLARLETKAFGAPSTSIDLSQRVDQLDQYADRHDLYGERRTASLPPAVLPNAIRPYANSPSEGQTQFSGSISERLAMMEAQEFGRTYPEHSLEKRVKKLDEKVFSNDKKRFADKPLPDQVNALWLTLHPNGNNSATPLLGSSPGAPAVDAYSSGSSQYQSTNSGADYGSSNATTNGRPHHGWLHALAKTAGTVGKVAVGSMSGYGGYPGYGYGSGFGGYGGGYGGFPGSGYGGLGNGGYFGAPSMYGNTLPYSY